MSVPSFLYSALDRETQALAAELASLGGGDANQVPMEVHCILDDRLEKGDNQTVWINDKSTISLRDKSLPLHSAIDAMKKYSFNSAYTLQDILQHPSYHFTPLK